MLSQFILQSIIAFAAVVPASYPGGQEAMESYITENIKYPEMPLEMGVEGIVPLSVQILPDGKVGVIKVERMLDPDLEQEAIRIVKGMPQWQPAANDGVAVESTVNINVEFTLPQ